MSQNQSQSQSQFVYELQVGGIRCTSCANKIRTVLPSKVKSIK